MKICIDIQSAVTQRAGVGRYTKLLVQNLDEIIKEHSLHLVYFDYKKNGAPFRTKTATHKAVRWCPGRAAQLAWKSINWPPFDFFAGKYDLYHFPNFVLPPLSSGKTVVTIHDVSFLRFPEFTEEKNLHHLKSRIRKTVEKADAIITVSRFSAEEIITLLNVDSSKVHPIHLGIADSFTAPPDEEIKSTLKHFGIDGPYIFSASTIEPRKNISFMIDLFEKLSRFDGKLVIAGNLGWKYEPVLQKIIKSTAASRIIRLDYVADEYLPSLYAGADLFMITSFYEGFGFPPLEAMACGTPVISSACGSLPEVLGDAAVQINGFRIDEWICRTEKLLSDTGDRTRLVEAGIKQAGKYRWSETARNTLDVYNRIA